MNKKIGMALILPIYTLGVSGAIGGIGWLLYIGFTRPYPENLFGIAGGVLILSFISALVGQALIREYEDKEE